VRVTPDPVAVPVETERRDRVDGSAATVFADAVVAAGHRISAVIEQVGQHVDRDISIHMTLGMVVPVGTGRDRGFVDVDPVAGAQDGRAEIHSRCRASRLSMLIGVRPWGLRRGVGRSVSSAGGV
jgi:hypothetical protein